MNLSFRIVYIRHVSIRLLFYMFYALFVRLYNLIYSLRLGGREHTVQILTAPFIQDEKDYFSLTCYMPGLLIEKFVTPLNSINSNSNL